MILGVLRVMAGNTSMSWLECGQDQDLNWKLEIGLKRHREMTDKIEPIRNT